jgi:hypothetical protein
LNLLLTQRRFVQLHSLSILGLLRALEKF